MFVVNSFLVLFGPHLGLNTGMVLSAAVLIIIAGAIVLFIGCFGCTGNAQRMELSRFKAMMNQTRVQCV